MKKIIIRTPNFIGDTINTTPCLELIKQEYPEAEFTIVGPDFVRELFKYDPRITHYITFPLKRKKKLFSIPLFINFRYFKTQKHVSAIHPKNEYTKKSQRHPNKSSPPIIFQLSFQIFNF